jgi:hypothetical protein
MPGLKPKVSRYLKGSTVCSSPVANVSMFKRYNLYKFLKTHG